MTLATKTTLSIGTATAALMLASVPASAAVLTFTDQAAFEAEFAGNVITEEFNGDASDFGVNTAGNAIGSGITVDVNAAADDSGPTGLTGNGQFESEVDSFDDILTIDFNFEAPLFGFGFVIQNDSQSNPAGLDLEEIGIQLVGESFILSDILGLSDSSDGALVDNIDGDGPQFFGFISDTAFSSLTFVHGDDVASGGVNGNNESFFLNSAVLAPEISAVPLPAGGVLLMSGLAGIAALRRRKTRAA